MSRPGRSAPRDGRREAGFTLLEIVVALVVLGVLLATLSRGTQFGLAVFDRQDRMIETSSRLQGTDRLLRRLIETADPGTSADGRTVTGGAAALSFRAPLPGTGTPEEGERLVDLRLSVQSGQLVLAWTPHRHALRVGPPPRPRREVLLDGVERIECGYFSEGSWRKGWAEKTPPALIRIRILFPEGDKRHWPDIVAAPMREPLPG